MLVFSYGNKFTAPYTDDICDVLQLGGVAVSVVETQASDCFDETRISRHQGRIIYVSDNGLQFLPKISSQQYVNSFGDDLDFVAIQSLDIFRRDLQINKDQDIEIEANAEILRAVAVRVDAIIRTLNPRFVVVAHGADPWTKVVSAKCAKYEVPCFYWESSFFSDRILIDRYAPHFFWEASELASILKSRIAQVNSRTAFKNSENFIANWKKGRQSKHLQLEAAPDLVRFNFFKNKYKHIIFVPMQLPWDASIFGSVSRYRNSFDFYRDVVESASTEFGVVFKVHPQLPSNFSSDDMIDFLSRENVILIKDVSIHDLLPNVDMVAVFSSNVGLEAAMYEKPVIVAGRPIYSNLGFTFDISENSALLRDQFHLALDAKFNKKRFNAFIQVLLEFGLTAKNDKDAARRLVRRLLKSGNIKKPSRTPFAEHDPVHVREIISAYQTRRRCE